MSEKVTAARLERRAMVYVRQSSQHQLAHNTESARLQYAMEARVRGLGWKEIEVVDEDQGRSATSTTSRTGFQRMVAEVALGKIGAVAAIEVSRFARNNRDWHQLIEMCAMVDTLLIDHEAIYDPRHANDRLLLGLKGTMSEYEIDLLRQRSLEARWAKARRGDLVIQAPIGFIKTNDQRLEKDPDLRVQHAIKLVFEKLFELGSARRVAMWFIDNNLDLPAKRHTVAGWETWWKRPGYGSVIRILLEPTYAGAYAYGKTTLHKRVVDGALLRNIARKPLDEWAVLIPEHHDGYISWHDFLRIQKMLHDNSARFVEGRPLGAPKRGPALLAGLLRCRRCGRKLMVGYSGKHAAIPRYECHRGRLDNMEAKCISFGGLSVDEAVSREILRVVQPAAIDAAALAVSQEGRRQEELVAALLLELKAACYAEGLARKQHNAVDPENRLVAAELERRWNSALEKVSDVEGKLESARVHQQPRQLDRASLGSVACDLDRVWNSPETDSRLKKRIVRTLVEEIVVELDVERGEVELVIHWKGGVHSELRIARRRRGQGGPRTSADVDEAIRQLVLVCDDKGVASVLTRNGIVTTHGHRWSGMAVCSFRSKRGIAVHSNESSEWLNLTEAAALLNVSQKTVRRAAEDGEVNAMHPLEHGPWIFRRADLEAPAFRQRFAHRQERGGHPAGPDRRQLNLMISSTYRGEAE